MPPLPAWYPPARRVGVIDTDALLNDLGARLSDPGISLFARSGMGATRWVASAHVLREVYQADKLENANKFHKIARQSVDQGWPTSPQRLQEVFEDEYLPAISFVEMGAVLDDHPMPESVADEKDVPTAQLAALLALTECVVYSCDKHLRTPAIAPPDLAPILRAARVADAADAVAPSIVVAGGLVGVTINTAISSVSTRLRMPKLVGWSAAAVLLAWSLAKEERRSSLRRGLRSTASAIGEVLANGTEAENDLAAVSIRAPDEAPLECHVARTLALSPRPLLVREIQEDLKRRDLLEPVPSDTSIRSLVRSLPCFVEVGAHRWQLGAVHDARQSRPTDG